MPLSAANFDLARAMGAGDRPLRWAQIASWNTANHANPTSALTHHLKKLTGNNWSLVTEQKKSRLEHLPDPLSALFFAPDSGAYANSYMPFFLMDVIAIAGYGNVLIMSHGSGQHGDVVICTTDVGEKLFKIEVLGSAQHLHVRLEGALSGNTVLHEALALTRSIDLKQFRTMACKKLLKQSSIMPWHKVTLMKTGNCVPLRGNTMIWSPRWLRARGKVQRRLFTKTSLSQVCIEAFCEL